MLHKTGNGPKSFPVRKPQKPLLGRVPTEYYLRPVLFSYMNIISVNICYCLFLYCYVTFYYLSNNVHGYAPQWGTLLLEEIEIEIEIGGYF